MNSSFESESGAYIRHYTVRTTRILYHHLHSPFPCPISLIPLTPKHHLPSPSPSTYGTPLARPDAQTDKKRGFDLGVGWGGMWYVEVLVARRIVGEGGEGGGGIGVVGEDWVGGCGRVLVENDRGDILGGFAILVDKGGAGSWYVCGGCCAVFRAGVQSRCPR